jgi:hypothetical protein
VREREFICIHTHTQMESTFIYVHTKSFLPW